MERVEEIIFSRVWVMEAAEVWGEEGGQACL
jgi:hypothetical protein